MFYAETRGKARAKAHRHLQDIVSRKVRFFDVLVRTHYPQPIQPIDIA